MSMDRFFDIAAEPMVCGVTDCCIAVRVAIQDKFGIDLMSGGRDKYRTPRQAIKEAKRRGNRNVGEAIIQAAREAGFKDAVGDPIDWDIGIVRYFDSETKKEEFAPAIFIKGFWMVRTHGGAEAMKADPKGVLRYGV